MSDIVKIGSPDTLPEAAPFRNARQKYPWKDMRPGDWFRFADSIKPGSARVLASNSGNAWGYKFHVFAGVDGALYCRRVDGLDASERFLRVKRDEWGNPVLPQAVKHGLDEPTARPIGRGRIYGENIPQEPMPGETMVVDQLARVGVSDLEDEEREI